MHRFCSWPFVSKAYEVLSDEKKRGAYDQFGHAGVDPSGGPTEDPFAGFAVRREVGGGAGGRLSTFNVLNLLLIHIMDLWGGEGTA